MLTSAPSSLPLTYSSDDGDVSDGVAESVATESLTIESIALESVDIDDSGEASVVVVVGSSVDPEQPVFEIASMDQLLGSMVAQRRFSMALLGTFAGLALALGIVGVYGVTSYLVAQRTREVGVRLALGAQPSQVVHMVVRQGMVVAAIGLGVGLIGAIVAGRFMTGLLYGVGPFDVATLAGVTAVIGLATLVANWLPALRAAHVDPLTALRND